MGNTIQTLVISCLEVTDGIGPRGVDADADGDAGTVVGRSGQTVACGEARGGRIGGHDGLLTTGKAGGEQEG